MMHQLRKYAGAALFAAALMAPVAVVAQDDHRDENRSHRYYDRGHKDYHEWNDNEDRSYRQYLNEHHQKHRDFSRLSSRQQRDYWRWRHDHGEGDRGSDQR